MARRVKSAPKVGDIVEVLWKDAFRVGDASSFDVDEVDKIWHDEDIFRESGYVAGITKEYICLASEHRPASRNFPTNEVRHAIFIPRAIVQSISVCKKASA